MKGNPWDLERKTGSMDSQNVFAADWAGGRVQDKVLDIIEDGVAGAVLLHGMLGNMARAVSERRPESVVILSSPSLQVNPPDPSLCLDREYVRREIYYSGEDWVSGTP